MTERSCRAAGLAETAGPNRWRRRCGGALGLLILGLAITVMRPPRPLLVWNGSASAPLGLYAVGGTGGITRGDMVIARVPRPWRALAAARHYLPANVPLVKRVAAIPGDIVCAAGSHVLVNGRRVASRRVRDGKGRPMPAWRGCIRLRGGALFLLMAARSGSFDGRYFGPTRASDIIGEARLLWAR